MQNCKTSVGTTAQKSSKDEANNVNPQLQQCNVSGSLLSDEEIREAANEWVFVKNGMKWSNNDDTAGDNYGSFMAGVKWALSRLCNDQAHVMGSGFDEDDEQWDEPEPCPTCGDIDGMVNPCCAGYDPLHYKNCGYG